VPDILRNLAGLHHNLGDGAERVVQLVVAKRGLALLGISNIGGEGLALPIGNARLTSLLR
jgi:hypothetical protein